MRDASRDSSVIVVGWLVLAAVACALARPQASVPGLFYDEAHAAAMARDCLTGRAHPHLPGSAFVAWNECRFPTFIQSYGGALKSWLLLPSFAVFGASQPVLRWTALGYGVVGLLLCMLWVSRWLGTSTALLAGALLAFDPSWFFVNVLDWGPVFPSFLCRFACFYFAASAWRSWSAPAADVRSGSLHALLAGLAAGLGFFNKVDFAVILAGVVLAFVCCNARRIGRLLGTTPRARLVRPLALATLGFLLTGAPMLTHVPRILRAELPNPRERAGGGELSVKLETAVAMYDGTYFHRLLDQGGVFERLSESRPPFHSLLGPAAAVGSAVLIYAARRRRSEQEPAARAGPFIVLCIAFITLGVFVLPGAVRIHHMVAVYPFPHLAAALAVTRVASGRNRLWSAAAAALVALLLVSQLLATLGTQRLIRSTGGRGWWSDALTAFALEVKERSDLTIVSLDWGFNEQLAFLTDGPRLVEPFWRRSPALVRSPSTIFLVHPTQYRLFSLGGRMLDEARNATPESVELRAWRDRQGDVAFYSLRWLQSAGSGNTGAGAPPR